MGEVDRLLLLGNQVVAVYMGLMINILLLLLRSLEKHLL
jgi:hypothetical protein